MLPKADYVLITSLFCVEKRAEKMEESVSLAMKL